VFQFLRFTQFFCCATGGPKWNRRAQFAVAGIILLSLTALAAPVHAQVWCGQNQAFNGDSGSCEKFNGTMPANGFRGTSDMPSGGQTITLQVAVNGTQINIRPSCSGSGCGALSANTVICSRVTTGGECNVSFTYLDHNGTTVAVSTSHRGSSDKIFFRLNGGTFDKKPTIKIKARKNTMGAFAVRFVASEPLSGFSSSDVIVNNGTIGSFQAELAGERQMYHAVITPANGDQITIDIPAGVAADGDGNGNLAAAQMVVNNTTVDQTHQAIARVLADRANLIIQSQPDVLKFLSDDVRTSRDRGGFYLSIDDANGEVAMASGKALARLTGLNIWAELHGARSRDLNATGTSWLGSIGAHQFLGEHTIVGALLQFDQTASADSVSGRSATGHGWLIGPYVAGRISNTSLFYDARILMGRSGNSISPFGTYSDSFSTRRLLVTGKITGTQDVRGLTVKPHAGVNVLRETQSAYIDSLSAFIPATTYTFSDADVGVELSDTIIGKGGTVFSPSLALAARRSFNSGTGVSALTTGIRGRLDMGISARFTNGWNVNATYFNDGLSLQNYSASGVFLKASRSF